MKYWFLFPFESNSNIKDIFVKILGQASQCIAPLSVPVRLLLTKVGVPYFHLFIIFKSTS